VFQGDVIVVLPQRQNKEWLMNKGVPRGLTSLQA
jgi:hypothetical protein